MRVANAPPNVRSPSATSYFLHLVIADLDGCLPAEDRHQHLELGRVLVDLRDLAREIRQGARYDLHGLADRELGACPGTLGGLAVEQAVDLGLAERDGLVAC